MTATALRLLLVEDTPLNLELETIVLQRANFEVTPVSTGEDALEALAREDFDVVALDIRLPGLDGIEVVRRIRKNPLTADLPVVAITALAMPGDRELALEAGCNAYVTKPARARELADAITGVVRARHEATSESPQAAEPEGEVQGAE